MTKKHYLKRTEDYLQHHLIPFWEKRIEEKIYGGFQTNYGFDGNPTEITEKSLLAQCRSIFTIAHVLRSGFMWKDAHGILKRGITFLFEHYRDNEYDGYYWIIDQKGTPSDENKVIYGHSFLIYALSEYALLTGDKQCRDEAVRIFDLLQEKAADPIYGGYYEHFDRQFNLTKVRDDNKTFKSMDVHMHLMEAFTTLYELTGDSRHRTALEEMVSLIFSKMIDNNFGTGISMFTSDWQPIPNVELGTVWGADRFDDRGKSTDITSYGHNIECVWLYLHAQDILGRLRKESLQKVLPTIEHTFHNGVDWNYGGLFVEGERNGPVTEDTKEFWQQAEGLVGFLDAYLLIEDEKYFNAFANIHDFIFTKMINWDLGEWYALLDRKGNVLWDYMGTSWKTNYHTVRGMCETVKRLRLTVTGNE